MSFLSLLISRSECNKEKEYNIRVKHVSVSENPSLDSPDQEALVWALNETLPLPRLPIGRMFTSAQGLILCSDSNNDFFRILRPIAIHGTNIAFTSELSDQVML